MAGVLPNELAPSPRHLARPRSEPPPEFMTRCRRGVQGLPLGRRGWGTHVPFLPCARLTDACPHRCPRPDPKPVSTGPHVAEETLQTV